MATVGEIATSIRNVGASLKVQVTAFGWSLDQLISAYTGPQTIAISANTFLGYVEIVASRVSRLTKTQLETDDFGIWLARLSEELSLLQFSSINHSPATQITNALSVIQMIDTAIPPQPTKEPKVNWESLKDQKDLLPRDLRARLKAVSSRLDDLEPRSSEIAAKITDIENAHAAADQLPTDLAELSESKDQISNALVDAKGMLAAISLVNEDVVIARDKIEGATTEVNDRLASSQEHADSLIKRSEQALRGSTSVGLSKSFATRKDALARASLWWTFGLIMALIVSVIIGWERITALREVMNDSRSATVILVNALLAVLGVGAPIWFAWLATKQIGTTFRLSEDYAFKSSVAQAYEGYRAEAVTIDEALRSRLFASALDRFEEAPMRLVDATYHSSPLQEIMNNPLLRKSLESIPNIADKIIALLPVKAGGVAAIAAPVAVGATIASRNSESEKDID